uniref:Uncharacterized protein n=1 Tax=Timema bartmani TaxID=61472 RepID=A0A7R9F567_9NEOP|nr:unnamed protein product [Timema bartmani]
MRCEKEQGVRKRRKVLCNLKLSLNHSEYTASAILSFIEDSMPMKSHSIKSQNPNWWSHDTINHNNSMQLVNNNDLTSTTPDTNTNDLNRTTPDTNTNDLNRTTPDTNNNDL